MLHRDLRDEIFGVPGTWGFRSCPDDGLLWLDPAPLAEALAGTYEGSSTHEESSIRRSLTGRIWFALLPLFARSPVRSMRDVADAELMWLGGTRPGRLLDVGAGDGSFLSAMRRRGWEVHGVEPDPRARERALREHGVALTPGTIDDVPTEERFDAVVLDNVLEHVPDPVATLRRAWSLLRPSGRLVVLTPNAKSLGHARFGARWRGLEPPRHLFLFSRRALATAAERAGAPPTVRSTPRALPFTWIASGGGVSSLPALAWAYVHEARSDAGEELLLDAVKP